MTGLLCSLLSGWSCLLNRPMSFQLPTRLNVLRLTLFLPAVVTMIYLLFLLLPYPTIHWPPEATTPLLPLLLRVTSPQDGHNRPLPFCLIFLQSDVHSVQLSFKHENFSLHFPHLNFIMVPQSTNIINLKLLTRPTSS